MSDERAVHPDCRNASNPYHECSDYCFRVIAEAKIRSQQQESEVGQASGGSNSKQAIPDESYLGEEIHDDRPDLEENSDSDPDQPALQEAEQEEVDYTKLSARQKKWMELRAKMQEAKKRNQIEIAAEKKRMEAPTESRGVSKQKWLEDRKKKIGKLLDANGLDMTKAYMLDTQEAAEEKYKKWEKDPAPFGWDVFNQKTLYNAYKKRTKNVEVDVEEYNRMKEADPEFYRDASSLQYGKAPKISEEKIDKMVQELKNRDEKRNSFSRRRRFHEEKDIDSINDRNEHFNKKIERAFGKYTLEIKNNLERDAGFLSSNQDLSNLPLVTVNKDQPSDEDDLPYHISEIQNQVVQQASYSDQQEGACRTVTENSLSLETPVSRPVDDLMEPLEQVQPLSSVESPPDRDTAREMQNILVSSSVDFVPDNQSINDSVVMEPPEQEGQLPSAGILSSNQDLANLPLVTRTEDQPSNEDGISNHIPETSIEIQNQAVGQCASNVELDSCSRQVVHPASNMDLDSLLPGGFRRQSSDTRNLSTLTENNSHPVQPASQSASRIIRHLCLDPLTNELERLRILTDQNMKEYENKKLQLKCDFEKELEELYRKYDIKRKEIEVEFQNIRKNLDTRNKIVFVNKILAEAFRAKSMDLKVSGASRMQQDASVPMQLFQLASQQNATQPCLVGASSCGPPAASVQSSYATTTTQTMVSPIQATYSTPGTFSSVSPRLPHINSLSSPLGNVQTAGEIRAPAPHLQPYRPPTSIPASSPCTVPHGRPGQPTPGNIPVTSPPFSHRTPRPMPANFQSVPHRGHWPVSTGGLSTPNLSAAMNSRGDANSQPGINLANVRPHMPDLPTLMNLNLSKFGCNSSPANSAHQATSPDVVCLSDDE